MPEIIIQPLTEDKWKDVSRIYKSGIATGNATFEKQVPDWKTWDKSHRKDCRFIALTGVHVAGWAALSNVSGRCVYAGVAEISIYVDADSRGQGVGDKLMNSIIKESESVGIWTLQAGIFPENTASVKLHERHGFRIIGVRERIGKMDGKWRDTVIMERRSKITGID
jgi:L-amino acid N-acyltransferase YncA